MSQGLYDKTKTGAGEVEFSGSTKKTWRHSLRGKGKEKGICTGGGLGDSLKTILLF